MNSATAYRYLRTLRRSPLDTLSMFLRPLLSGALFAIFGAFYLDAAHGPAFLIISVAIVTLFTNAIQGAAYEAREDAQGRRMDIIRMAPGGLRQFCRDHAALQTGIAFMESGLLILVALPFLRAEGSTAIAATPLLAGTVVLTVVSAASSCLGVHLSLRRHNFLAVSFVSVLLVTFGGAFYAVDTLPAWAQLVSRANPMTYVVDLVRSSFFGEPPLLPVTTEVAIGVGCAAALAVATALLARRPLELEARS